MPDEKKLAEKAAKRKAELDDWKASKKSQASWNDKTAGRILYNPGKMIVEQVTPISDNTESVLVRSKVTGVTEDVLYRPNVKEKDRDRFTMRNYMKQVTDADGNPTDTWEPSSRSLEKLIEVRPFTYGDGSPRAGQTVMRPMFYDKPKASIEIPRSIPGPDENSSEGAKNGAIISGFLKLINEDDDKTRLMIGMRDQNGGVPDFNGTVFFDVPKSVENNPDNFTIRAVLNDLRAPKEDGTAKKGIYAEVACLLDANAFERPAPVQKEGENQESYDKRIQNWQKHHDIREKHNIQSREVFVVTDVLGMRPMKEKDREDIYARQENREQAPEKQSQSQGMKM